MTKKIFVMPSANDMKRAAKERRQKEREAKQGQRRAQVLQEVEARLAKTRAAESVQRVSCTSRAAPKSKQAIVQPKVAVANVLHCALSVPSSMKDAVTDLAAQMEHMLSRRLSRRVTVQISPDALVTKSAPSELGTEAPNTYLREAVESGRAYIKDRPDISTYVCWKVVPLRDIPMQRCFPSTMVAFVNQNGLLYDRWECGWNDRKAMGTWIKYITVKYSSSDSQARQLEATARVIDRSFRRVVRPHIELQTK